ncbi:MAG: FKBP-type peptidyl-prolyl cis-trans isomerase [Planctomycetota bacterium]
MNTVNPATRRLPVMTTAGVILLLAGLAVGSDPPVPTTQPAAATETRPATTQPIEEEGFTTTESGLKYKDLKEGEGPQAQPMDLLKMHFKGTLEDGTQFDNSYERGTPVPVRIGAKPPRLIVGWEEGLATMKAGGKRVLIVPPQLGFGLRGMPPKIPANATLRFEIEVLGIEPAPKMTETKPEDEVTTQSGLRYVDLKVGDGASPTAESILKVRAATWAPDGTLMNTLSEREDPATVPLAQIGHPAIKEGMMGMKAGGRRKLWVPRSQPPTSQLSTEAPPLQMIIEVDLLEVTEAPPPPTTTQASEED